jgi:hypothetical protein
LICQHVKTPPSPTPQPQFCFACGGLSQRCVYRHLLPQKIPQFVFACDRLHKDVYMASSFPGKNLQFFFRLRHAVTKICIWPPTKKRLPVFFACGELSQSCVYGHLRTYKPGTIYKISTLFSNSPAGKYFRPFLGRYLSQK